VSSSNTLDDGRHELAFADGTRTVVDVLVGADGAWSKARHLLTDAAPTYCGITLVELLLTATNPHHAAATATVGTGSLFALSDGKAMLGHGGDRIWIGAGLQVPSDWVRSSGIPWSDDAAARAALLREFADWSPALTDLIRFCDNGIVPRPIFALPVGTAGAGRPASRWSATPRTSCRPSRARAPTWPCSTAPNWLWPCWNTTTSRPP
jgi:2-polyprenyl-6-methoxyphenol hydroxylase-like FAD-dependent oxidoreductase